MQPCGHFPLLWSLARAARALAAASAAVLVTVQAAAGAEAVPAKAGAPPELLTFRVGLAQSCFQNVNRNDAAAACRLFIENLGRRQGYRFETEAQVFDNPAALHEAVQRGAMHVLVMEATQYLELSGHDSIKPAFVPSVGGHVGRKFLILTRRDASWATPADLRGHTVLCLGSANADACHRWLGTLMPGVAADERASFLSGFEVVGKAMAAVLPVFFGKKDACIIDDYSFALITEMNPQVGQVLRVLAESPRFLDMVICVGEAGWPTAQARADTLRGLGELQLDAAGRQILTLFKIAQLEPFDPAQLDSVRALLAAPNPEGSP